MYVLLRAILMVIGLVCVAGCNKIRDFELEKPTSSAPGGSSPPPVITPAPSSSPAASPPPVTAAAPPQAPKTPEQIINEFVAGDARGRTDDTLKKVAALPEAVDRFTELDLSASFITDDGLKSIGPLKKIESLKLAGTRIMGEGLGVISELPALTRLDVSNCISVDTRGFAAIGRSPTITELNLSSLNIGDETIVELKDLRALRVLRVGGCANLIGRTFADIVAKGAFPELRELYAGGSPFVFYGLASLNRLKNLEVLDASQQEMNDGVIEGFENCRMLRKLSMSGSKVSNNGLKLLMKLKQLEELDVGGCRGINDGGLAALRSQRQLKKLNLNGTSCTPAGVDALKRILKDTEIVFSAPQ